MADEFTAKFKVDISDLKKNLSDAQSSIKKANATFKAETAGMDKWTKDADGLGSKLKQLDTILSSQKSILKAYEEELQRNKDAYAENGKRAEQLRAKLEELAANGVGKTSEEYQKYKQALTDCEKEQDKNAKAVEDLEIKVLEQTAAVKDTEKQINHYNDTLDELEKGENEAEKGAEDLKEDVKESGDAAKKAEGGFTVMKAALADLVASGIKAAVAALKDLADGIVDAYESYDEGADNIIKKTGATGEAADALMESYDAVTKSIIGDFADMGAAVGEVATRFDTTGDELTDLTTKFLKFAEINDTDVTSAIDSSQSAMAAWGMESKDTGKYLDMVTAASQATGTSVDSINSALVTNATALKEMGYSAEESAFFVAKLDKAGVDASSVMSGMKKALANATAEGKPLSQAMEEMEERIRNASDSTEAMSIASELFGSKAGPALATAVREGNLSFQELGVTMEDFEGTVDDTYDSTLDASDHVQLAIQNLKAEAGKAFGAFLDEHGPEIKKMLDTFTEKVLPVLIKVLGKVFDALSWIIDKIPVVIQWIKTTAANIQTFVNNVKTWVDTTKTRITDFFTAIKTTAQTVINTIKSFFTSLWTGIVSGATDAWSKVKGAFSGVTSFFSGIWNTVRNSFTALGTNIGNAIGSAVKKGINGVISKIESTINSAIGIINGAINLINMIPGVSVRKVSKISLPRLAQGGVLAKGQVGLLEGSGAEAVVPLDQNRKWIHAVASSMNREITGGSSMVDRSLHRNVTSNTNFTQIINAPKSPSRIELYRQTRNLLAYTRGGI